jgi:2-polyprenyl-6-methoxyphenol hydroxylase-like FAD-dependent oxidoreductase
LYYVGKRKLFDAWLVSKIDKKCTRDYFNCEVNSIERTNNKVTLTCNNQGTPLEITANLVIGADGERSVVKKYLDPKGIKKVREHHVAAIRCYYKM